MPAMAPVDSEDEEDGAEVEVGLVESVAVDDLVFVLWEDVVVGVDVFESVVFVFVSVSVFALRAGTGARTYVSLCRIWGEEEEGEDILGIGLCARTDMIRREERRARTVQIFGSIIFSQFLE